ALLQPAPLTLSIYGNCSFLCSRLLRYRGGLSCLWRCGYMVADTLPPSSDSLGFCAQIQRPPLTAGLRSVSPPAAWSAGWQEGECVEPARQNETNTVPLSFLLGLSLKQASHQNKQATFKIFRILKFPARCLWVLSGRSIVTPEDLQSNQQQKSWTATGCQ
ncbi:hypothetical protein LEMLEM_LOCUS27756, partial [Lemmus lemmus]